MRNTRIFSREVETVGAGVDLEKAPNLFRVSDNSLDVELITRPLEQKSASRMPQNIEVPVIHGPQDTLCLLTLAKAKRECTEQTV